MLDLEKLCKELQEQDKQLKKIFKRREEIKTMAINENMYEKLDDMMYDDYQEHWDF